MKMKIAGSVNQIRDVGQDGILRADWQSALGRPLVRRRYPSRKRKRPNLLFNGVLVT
jgi:hypothetical protein